MMKQCIHRDFPKTVGRTEFWKQIKRTVNGKEVSEKDIETIVSQVMGWMAFDENDHLLDLGCGNGALAANFFPYIGRYTGVDFSEYLLGVAREFFCPNEDVVYIEGDAVDYVMSASNPANYTKVMMYGAMSYLSRDRFLEMLAKIHDSYARVSKVYIGNIPNAQKAVKFFSNRNVSDFDLDDHESSIGVWWSPDEIAGQCREIGFTADILFMPKGFYASEYRFDLLLTRN